MTSHPIATSPALADYVIVYEPSDNGRFVVLDSQLGTFHVARLDRKRKGGVSVLRTPYAAADLALATYQAPSQADAPKPDPSPDATDKALEQGPTLDEAPSQTGNVATLKAWMANTQWRVGSHMIGDGYALISRPSSKAYMARDWRIVRVRSGVVSIMPESMSNRNSAYAILISYAQSQVITARLDALPQFPAGMYYDTMTTIKERIE